PGVRWWEAMAVPRRAVQVVELAEGVTLVSLVCEDLARLDEVADLLRAIGPTVVVTTLLDGPQLASRWTAGSASVLAADPGPAVGVGGGGGGRGGGGGVWGGGSPCGRPGYAVFARSRSTWTRTPC